MCEPMLAIFLSFRVAGAAAAWIAAPEGQARFRRADGSGKLCAAAAHASVEHPRRTEILLDTASEGRDVDAGNVRGRDACDKRAIPGAALNRG
jgi:hypothetical protein